MLRFYLTLPRATYQGLTHWGQVTHICISKKTSLVQAMACRLVGAKPLPEPMQDYCQLKPWEQTSVKPWAKFIYFHSRKCICKFCQELVVILFRPQCIKKAYDCRTNNKFKDNIETGPGAMLTFTMKYENCYNEGIGTMEGKLFKMWVKSLQWRHNVRDDVSNHQPHECLLNRLLRRRSKKTSKPRVTGLCAGNSPVTDEFPTQRASNAENVSIWRHHVLSTPVPVLFWCPTTKMLKTLNTQSMNVDGTVVV